MMFELCKRFVKTESVTLVVDGGKTEYIKIFKDEGIKVISLNKPSTNSLLFWLFLPYFTLSSALQIRRVAKQNEIILSSTYPSHYIAMLVGLLNKSKTYYCYCFEPFPFFYSRSFMKSSGSIQYILFSILATLFAWTDKIAIRGATKVFTLNKITQEEVSKVYNRDSVVTLMGVDTKHFSYKAAARANLNPNGDFLVLHSTDYSEMKKTDIAIRAMGLFLKMMPRGKLFITSTRPGVKEKHKYELLVKQLGIAGQVKFLNMLPYDKLPHYYSAADCYLSTSSDRSLGTTSSNLPVKEAMACETACVRSKITDEDVVNGVTGYLVDTNSPAECANALYKLSQLPQEELKNMGKMAREKIVRIYQWNAVVDVVKSNMMMGLKYA